MANQLRVSRATQEIFTRVGGKNGLQPFAMAKLAIALSLRKGPLEEKDFQTDNEGQELNRQTIFGDHDLLFKSLIISRENRSINEEEYFPSVVKAHLDRGAKLLEDEKRYTKDFYNHLCRLDMNI